MDSESGEDLGALLESTLTLSRGLETLYSEHEVLLQALGEERGSDASNRASDHGQYHNHTRIRGVLSVSLCRR